MSVQSLKPMSIDVIRYDSHYKAKWDTAVGEMRNATFLHLRDFMEYHADRFEDASLLCYKDNKIKGLFAANYSSHTASIYAHQGLTYGGLLLPTSTRYDDIEEMMTNIIKYYRAVYPQAQRLIIKPTPYIYHTQSSDELLYWLHQSGATLSERSLSSSIHLNGEYNYSQLRRRYLKKAEREPWSIHTLMPSTLIDEQRLKAFWELLSHTLYEQHHVLPVHSFEEINRLWQLFPKQIRIMLVLNRETEEVIAGTVLFDTPSVRHAQYIANSSTGRAAGALELLFNYAICDAAHTHAYFDFGISTEHGGTVLNRGLLFQKEGFGARGVCYDTYTLNL